MKEIAKGIFVGTVDDYNKLKNNENFAFVAACKDPIHKKVVGYSGKSCEKSRAEYLYAIRDNLIALNMIDAPKPEFFSVEMIRAGLDFIHDSIIKGKFVLVFCNQGQSRSPAMVLMYLRDSLFFDKSVTFDTAFNFIKSKYPEFEPNTGIHQFMQDNWNNKSLFKQL